MQRNFLSSSMANIKQMYNRKALIEKVKANKKKHVEEFNAASAEYDKMLVQKLRKMVAAAEANLEAKPGTKKEVPHDVDLVRPKSFEKAYDIAINMLEMGEGDSIELPLNIFAQIVHDEWDWQDEFFASASIYNSDFR